MKINIYILLLCGLMAVSCNQNKEDILDYVNPNLGTVHSRWFVYTPASEPFGLAKLGASTNGTYGNKDGWEAVPANNKSFRQSCFRKWQPIRIPLDSVPC